MFSKIVSVLLVALLASGCSAYKSAEMTPAQVQQKIAAGDLAAVGDKVRVATTDGQTHRFKVTAVTDQAILGEDVSIPINDVTTVETLELSGGRTAAAVGGGVALWTIIVAVALGGTIAL